MLLKRLSTQGFNKNLRDKTFMTLFWSFELNNFSMSSKYTLWERLQYIYLLTRPTSISPSRHSLQCQETWIHWGCSDEAGGAEPWKVTPMNTSSPKSHYLRWRSTFLFSRGRSPLNVLSCRLLHKGATLTCEFRLNGIFSDISPLICHKYVTYWRRFKKGAIGLITWSVENFSKTLHDLIWKRQGGRTKFLISCPREGEKIVNTENGRRVSGHCDYVGMYWNH